MHPFPSQSLILLFSKLGILGFGGPVAHLAAIEREVVEKRQWLDREQLLDSIGIANLIPGPTSTQVVFQIGYLRQGIIGAVLAGISFIWPGMAIVWLLAIFYVKYQNLPEITTILNGCKPAILSSIIYAIYRLTSLAITDRATGIAALGVLIISGYFNISQIIALLVAGIGVTVWKNRQLLLDRRLRSLFPAELMLAILNPVDRISSFHLFWIFIKIGAVIYGGGYVLYAILQQELVDRAGLITSQQLLDAIAIGQVTPGPLFTTATFIGYLLAGNFGAIAATVGIFLPGAIWAIMVMPIVPKLQTSVWFQAWLSGIKAGAWALMAIVAIKLGLTTVGNGWEIGLTIANLALMWRFQVDVIWLILGDTVIYSVLARMWG
jgi:chromate transporter